MQKLVKLGRYVFQSSYCLSGLTAVFLMNTRFFDCVAYNANFPEFLRFPISEVVFLKAGVVKKEKKVRTK